MDLILRSLRRFPHAGVGILLAAPLFISSGVFAHLFANERSVKSEPIDASDLKISNVHVSTPSCRAAKKQVHIAFSLSKDAFVNLQLLDSDHELVKTLVNENRKHGEQSVKWDCRDMSGKAAPNDAYSFRIQAKDRDGHTSVYDPANFSGGELYLVSRADFNSEANHVKYYLPYSARVLIRLGLNGGPLMRTLVNWEPRPAGPVTETWDGRDESETIDLRKDSRFVALITSFTLPENSIIANANNTDPSENSQSILLSRTKQSVGIGQVPTSNRSISPHFGHPRSTYHNPKLQLTLPEVKDLDSMSVPVIKGVTVVHVDMEEKEKAAINDRQAELYLFLDGTFLVEKAQIKIPYDLRWDFSKLEDGQHILTVNLVTDHDQVGVASRQISTQKANNIKGQR